MIFECWSISKLEEYMLAKDGKADPYSFKYLETTKNVECKKFDDVKEYKNLIKAFEVAYLII